LEAHELRGRQGREIDQVRLPFPVDGVEEEDGLASTEGLARRRDLQWEFAASGERAHTESKAA
jgi:hypothetical protein